MTTQLIRSTLNSNSVNSNSVNSNSVNSSSMNGGISLLSVRDGLWRVTARTGAILGHIERHTTPGGDRFTARRLVFATLTREVGDFWNLADAVDCFR